MLFICPAYMFTFLTIRLGPMGRLRSGPATKQQVCNVLFYFFTLLEQFPTGTGAQLQKVLSHKYGENICLGLSNTLVHTSEQFARALWCKRSENVPIFPFLPLFTPVCDTLQHRRDYFYTLVGTGARLESNQSSGSSIFLQLRCQCRLFSDVCSGKLVRRPRHCS